ncbi:metallophosphoesterase family protein [Pseudoroseomonas globiformis]|uniref:Metallophosphoesterase family protein n=1 Tax=Teichococcus globiformis TaxID=2307229 RepID=A0ABV7FYY0_9PROT
MKMIAAPARLPDGLRVYAIGDVHGCCGRLTALHAAIAADWRVAPASACAVVHLGDYVDRGPNSAGVLTLLDGKGPIPGAHRILLRGNHEVMMLEALAAGPGTAAEDFWLHNGGRATLASYGATDAALRLPRSHAALLEGLTTSWQAGGYLFVHAGINPRRPMDQQDEHDLLWIREPFLSWPMPLPAIVVHGHTPARRVEIRQHRIGIDTGAVAGGALTALVLEADGLRLLEA